MVYLLTGREPGADPWSTHRGGFDARHLIDHLGDIPGRDRNQDAVTYLARFTLGTLPDEDRLRSWTDYVRSRGSVDDNDTIINLLALMTAAPEYQLC